MKHLVCGLAALVLLSSVGAAHAADYKPMTIRAATANPQGSQHVTALEKFKEVIETESNGAIKRAQDYYSLSVKIV